jgi:hypothetical protein
MGTLLWWSLGYVAFSIVATPAIARCLFGRTPEQELADRNAEAQHWAAHR